MRRWMSCSQAIVESGHSRFPVIGEDRDEVVGILLAKDVLRFSVESPGETLDLTGFLRPATFIPESKRLDTLLQEFAVAAITWPLLWMSTAAHQVC